MRILLEQEIHEFPAAGTILEHDPDQQGAESKGGRNSPDSRLPVDVAFEFSIHLRPPRVQSPSQR